VILFDIYLLEGILSGFLLLCVGVGSQTSSSSFQVQKLDEVEAVFVEVEADPPPVSSFPLHH